MRIWSLHPSYLDRAGLTACWREGLLARKVLEGNTKGYTRHPQLGRFRACGHPLAAIDFYLHALCDEAEERGYRFDRSKLGCRSGVEPIPVTRGQIAYELGHLLGKLEKRDAQRFSRLQGLPPDQVTPHPLFVVMDGPVEDWEIIR